MQPRLYSESFWNVNMTYCAALKEKEGLLKVICHLYNCLLLFYYYVYLRELARLSKCRPLLKMTGYWPLFFCFVFVDIDVDTVRYDANSTHIHEANSTHIHLRFVNYSMKLQRKLTAISGKDGCIAIELDLFWNMTCKSGFVNIA